MKRTENSDGTVEHKATKPHEDMRNFDSDGNFICNSDHPWSGNKEDAPKGVRHEEAIEDENGVFWCEPCDARWGEK